MTSRQQRPTGVILVCDDEAGFRRLTVDLLRQEGHQVYSAGTLQEAREALEESAFDLLLLDLHLPDGDGASLIDVLPAIAPGCLCLVVTAYASLDSAVETLTHGAHDYVEKPVRAEELVAKVSGLLERRALARENAALRRQVATAHKPRDVVAIDPAMLELHERARAVAERGRVALITGESGAGKEVLARFIHAHSPHADGPFIAANLAALPTNLAESTLFGHTRGAFTGAHTASEGIVRAASGGTLFLDEIGEAPLELQAKLLRLVDTGEILPVGSARPFHIDCQILAATNRDLEEDVRAGRFREDLYHRLNVLQLVVPPLRDRPAGIPALARSLLEELAASRGLSAPEIPPETEAALLTYHWPGNVRELRNALERALILGRGDSIRIEDLPVAIARAAGHGTLDATPLRPLRESVQAFERSLIRRAIAQCQGNRRLAAERLGISLATLYRKLNESEAPSEPTAP